MIPHLAAAIWCQEKRFNGPEKSLRGVTHHAVDEGKETQMNNKT